MIFQINHVLYIYNLTLICKETLSYLPHLFIYSSVYLYGCVIMESFATQWVIIHSFYILVNKKFWFWPVEVSSAGYCIIWTCAYLSLYNSLFYGTSRVASLLLTFPDSTLDSNWILIHLRRSFILKTIWMLCVLLAKDMLLLLLFFCGTKRECVWEGMCVCVWMFYIHVFHTVNIFFYFILPLHSLFSRYLPPSLICSWMVWYYPTDHWELFIYLHSFSVF